MKKKNRNERVFYVYTFMFGTPNFIHLLALWEPNVCMLIIAGELCVRIREVEVRI